eukprot:COSAG02_NODE_2101_length_9808_cov_3.575658_11_plen_74_part_00
MVSMITYLVLVTSPPIFAAARCRLQVYLMREQLPRKAKMQANLQASKEMVLFSNTDYMYANNLNENTPALDFA